LPFITTASCLVSAKMTRTVGINPLQWAILLALIVWLAPCYYALVTK